MRRRRCNRWGRNHNEKAAMNRMGTQPQLRRRRCNRDGDATTMRRRRCNHGDATTTDEGAATDGDATSSPNAVPLASMQHWLILIRKT
ncbi:MAG: hypothetical protein WKF36_04980 [Candidatus Nitrosocosmicus sp.]